MRPCPGFESPEPKHGRKPMSSPAESWESRWLRRNVLNVLNKHIKHHYKQLDDVCLSRSAEALEFQAEQGYSRHLSNEQLADLARIWLRAAVVRLPHLRWGGFFQDDLGGDPLLRRDLAMFAYLAVKPLHRILEFDDVYALRLGVEMTCSDPVVVEKMPSLAIREHNLIRLLLFSVTMVGRRHRVSDCSTVETVIADLTAPERDVEIREALHKVVDDIDVLSPEQGRRLRLLL